MKKLTPTQKRNILADFITLKSHCGYDISNYMGLPLNKFDFEKVEESISRLKLEYYDMTGSDFCFTYSERN